MRKYSNGHSFRRRTACLRGSRGERRQRADHRLWTDRIVLYRCRQVYGSQENVCLCICERHILRSAEPCNICSIASDVVPDRLAIARKMGADVVVDTRTESLKNAGLLFRCAVNSVPPQLQQFCVSCLQCSAPRAMTEPVLGSSAPVPTL